MHRSTKKRIIFLFSPLILATQSIIYSMNHSPQEMLVSAVKNEDINRCKKILIEQKADVNKPDKTGSTPLYWACKKNNLEIAKLIIPYCSQITLNQPNCNNKTPLYNACLHDNVELVTLLLKNGAFILTDIKLDKVSKKISNYLKIADVFYKKYMIRDGLQFIDIVRNKIKLHSERGRSIFNFTIELAFCRSVIKIMRKPSSFNTTIFCYLYKKSQTTTSLENELAFALKKNPKKFKYDEYIQEVVKNNEFYFAKKIILGSLFHKKLINTKNKKFSDIHVRCISDLKKEQKTKILKKEFSTIKNRAPKEMERGTTSLRKTRSSSFSKIIFNNKRHRR